MRSSAVRFPKRREIQSLHVTRIPPSGRVSAEKIAVLQTDRVLRKREREKGSGIVSEETMSEANEDAPAVQPATVCPERTPAAGSTVRS